MFTFIYLLVYFALQYCETTDTGQCGWVLCGTLGTVPTHGETAQAEFIWMPSSTTMTTTTSALGFTTMHYINRLFTYSLTYLLTTTTTVSYHHNSGIAFKCKQDNKININYNNKLTIIYVMNTE